MEEKNWEKVRDRLPERFEWRMKGARRRNRKGRTLGGVVLGIRGELIVKGGRGGGREGGDNNRQSEVWRRKFKSGGGLCE